MKRRRPGPELRTDVVDVYVFRRRGNRIEFLQLHRRGEPLKATWQPIMGHVHRDETAVSCARRELREEVGLASGSRALLGFWALEQVHPFFIAQMDAIFLSPRIAAEVPAMWAPRLNSEHDKARWVPSAKVDECFMWPGQIGAIREILGLLRAGSLSEPRLRLAGRDGPKRA